MEQKKITLEKLDLPFSESTEKLDFIKIDCPSCGTLIQAEHIDVEKQVGKCTNCQALFSVEEKITSLHLKSKEKETLKRPDSVQIFHFKEEVEIEIVQPFPILDTIILSLLPFIFFFAILLYFAKNSDPAMWVALVSGLGMTRSLIQVFNRKQNKIFINTNKKTIEILRRPKNFIADKIFQVSEIEQIYVKQTHEGVGLFFLLNTIDGQRHEQVIKRLKDTGQGKFIEQELEQYLAIKNKDVPGAI